MKKNALHKWITHLFVSQMNAQMNTQTNIHSIHSIHFSAIADSNLQPSKDEDKKQTNEHEESINNKVKTKQK